MSLPFGRSPKPAHADVKVRAAPPPDLAAAR